MASASTKKICATGNGCKQAAITTCEGCLQAFCTKHFTDHRNLLNNEINQIIGEHDDLKNSLTQQTKNPDSHPFIKQIDDWEKQSISKIQQRAKDLRLELLELTKTHTNECSQKLENLSRQINECREHGDFIETDLRRWKDILEDLKSTILSPSTMTIERDNGTPLVRNISVNLMKKKTNELFEKVSDNVVQISEKGQVAFRGDPANTYMEIRGRNEYNSGSHKIRLCIDELPGNRWIFFGINSKSTPLQNTSQLSKSTYGWSSNNNCWSNGKPNSTTANYSTEMKTNDIISLVFDCDNRKIFMINERTKTKYELTVNIDNCPLPWQLHVILFTPNTRVRILSDDFTP